MTAHFVRHHVGTEKFVRTQRVDRNEEVFNRNTLPQGTLNNMDMTANAQAMINISRKRCCRLASSETRSAWNKVLEAVNVVDPILVSKCQPECIYRGFCPEVDNTCGYASTEAFQQDLIKYRSVDGD